MSSRERVSFEGIGVQIAGDRWEPATGSARGTALLLHGGGQTRHSWQRTGERLARLGWEAIAVDARGHGDSEWAPDGDYSHRTMAADLRAIVGQLGRRPVLVGASMGGMAALIAQGADPGLGRALVLVDITPRVEQAGTEKIFAFMSSAPDGFASLEEASAAISAYNPHRKRPASLEGLKKNLRHRDGRWFWHWDPAFMTVRDEADRLLAEQAAMREQIGGSAVPVVRPEPLYAAAREIRVPTLLVRGRQSDIVSEEGAAELLQLIPHAEYVDVTGAGHMVAGDDNDVFAEHLGEFLGRLPAAAG
ncbi:putative hydrolase or acyltransferase of alpha/beta superfamily [Frankia sp. EI5c]|uniref:alpha/beta fold hydrolase n=1 Tax=Frankia sp. EI5c TaxID=683316 RepID=UPI0007C242BF|nr:alpha/beta hydrolase [Frankia sp. EI5c]OAA27689.1 putative hydrolase or acyltransferase of alpha/beta superfamily [Frankia sp. EI5c]